MTCTSRINVVKASLGGVVTIGGVLLTRAAFCVTDPSELRDSDELRGDDTLIPFDDDGLVAKRRRTTKTEVSLPIAIEGRLHPDGVTPYADPLVGALTNLEWLKANVAAPLGGDGLRLCVLDGPGPLHLEAPCHVLRSKLGKDRSSTGLTSGVIDLSFPQGLPR